MTQRPRSREGEAAPPEPALGKRVDVEEVVGEPLDAEHAPGERLLARAAHEDAEDLGGRDRHDGEVVGAEPQGREPEEQTEDDGGQRRRPAGASHSGPPWSTVIAVPYAPTSRKPTWPKLSRPV